MAHLDFIQKEKKILFILLIALLAFNKSFCNSPKEEVQEIYENLFKVFPYNATGFPNLTWIPNSKGKSTLAAFEGNSIHFNEELYDLCKSKFPNQYKDAIASILAHELSHFILGHDNPAGLAQTEINEIQAKAEAEADMLGLFRAYLAGYDVFDVWGKMIHAIYQHFEIFESADYFSPQERQNLAEETVFQTRETAYVLMVANNLFILSKNDKSLLDESIKCYDYLMANVGMSPTMKLILPDAYNNIGVAYLNKVLYNLPQDPKYAFAYPIELDPSKRLRDLIQLFRGNNQKPTQKDNFSENYKYLQRAENIFVNLIQAYPNYAPPYINRTITDIFIYLNDKSKPIDEFITDLENSHNSVQILPPDAYLVRGIAKYIRSEESEDSLEDFETAKKNGAYKKDFNYRLYQSKGIDLSTLRESPKPKPIILDNVFFNYPFKKRSVFDFNSDTTTIIETIIIGRQGKPLSIKVHKQDEQYLTVSLPEKTILFEYSSSSNNSFKNVRLNDPKIKVLEQFQNKPKEIATINGSFLQYDFENYYYEYEPNKNQKQEPGVIFQIADDKVHGWVKYIIEETPQ